VHIEVSRIILQTRIPHSYPWCLHQQNYKAFDRTSRKLSHRECRKDIFHHNERTGGIRVIKASAEANHVLGLRLFYTVSNPLMTQPVRHKRTYVGCVICVHCFPNPVKSFLHIQPATKECNTSFICATNEAEHCSLFDSQITSCHADFIIQQRHFREIATRLEINTSTTEHDEQWRHSVIGICRVSFGCVFHRNMSASHSPHADLCQNQPWQFLSVGFPAHFRGWGGVRGEDTLIWRVCDVSDPMRVVQWKCYEKDSLHQWWSPLFSLWRRHSG
jgi:hypothetical protein